MLTHKQEGIIYSNKHCQEFIMLRSDIDLTTHIHLNTYMLHCTVYKHSQYLHTETVLYATYTL